MAIVHVRVHHAYNQHFTDCDESTTDLVVADAAPWGFGNDYPVTATRSGWYLLGHTKMTWERERLQGAAHNRAEREWLR
jgi:hypothetical protein